MARRKQRRDPVELVLALAVLIGVLVVGVVVIGTAGRTLGWNLPSGHVATVGVLTATPTLDVPGRPPLPTPTTGSANQSLPPMPTATPAPLALPTPAPLAFTPTALPTATPTARVGEWLVTMSCPAVGEDCVLTVDSALYGKPLGNQGAGNVAICVVPATVELVGPVTDTMACQAVASGQQCLSNYTAISFGEATAWVYLNAATNCVGG